jgi:hypothetical protein
LILSLQFEVENWLEKNQKIDQNFLIKHPLSLFSLVTVSSATLFSLMFRNFESAFLFYGRHFFSKDQSYSNMLSKD